MCKIAARPSKNTAFSAHGGTRGLDTARGTLSFELGSKHREIEALAPSCESSQGGPQPPLSPVLLTTLLSLSLESSVHGRPNSLTQLGDRRLKEAIPNISSPASRQQS